MTQPVQVGVGTTCCLLCTHKGAWVAFSYRTLTLQNKLYSPPWFPRVWGGRAWGSCQGAAHRQVFGVCLPSCPDRCPGAVRAQ